MANGGQKWKDIPKEIAEQIKTYLLKEGGREDLQLHGVAEVWRVRFSNATITYYKSGTLYSTGSNDPAVRQAWEFIESLAGARFEPATKDFLIGFDEAGKGEAIGHTVLAGVLFSSELFAELEGLVSVADTKHKRQFAYWDDLFRKISSLESKNLRFLVETIPPWHVDHYNLNKIMDVVYQRILSVFSREQELSRCRVVIDDYGIGPTLDRYLRALQNAGAEIVRTSDADVQFLEARVASVLAKREREKIIESLKNNEEFQISGHTVGSGNLGDPETLAWLKAWKDQRKPWPWFVKKSFAPIRKLDGLSGKAKKAEPPIRDDLLSREFLEEFQNGRLSITHLSIVCPNCGTVSNAALITRDEKNGTVGRCLRCKQIIPELGVTLRYYCGYIIPDSNIILSGLLSKDLRRSRFFEGFTILLSTTVRKECDSPGGKRELGELARFGAMGRVRLKEVGSLSESGNSFERDQNILETALQYNAILYTNDQNVKAAAQARRVFVLTS